MKDGKLKNRSKLMVVHVTYRCDGYGGTRIDKIFNYKTDAINYINETRIKNDIKYDTMTENQIQYSLDQFIDTIEVII